ncbi:unnamed protein product [Rotaria sp. Silwood1]|nr:unnamed protein product [Rotaria sp. Silwood1]
MLGHLLIEMNKYRKAESYFQMMLQVLPKAHKDFPLVCDYKGHLNTRKTNWNEAYTNFNAAYEIRKKVLPLNHSLIGVTLNNIGDYYKVIENYDEALKYYEKALECKNDSTSIAKIQLNMSTIYVIYKDYDKALNLCIEARDYLQQLHIYPYNDIVRCHEIVGDIHLMQKKYSIADHYYFTVFEMNKNALLSDNILRIHCINSLVDLYNKQGLKQIAIDFCQDKLSAYEKDLSEKHINIAHFLMKLLELCEENDDQKINLLLRALRIFEKHVHFEYASTANCLMAIAEYHQKQNAYEEAIKYR